MSDFGRGLRELADDAARAHRNGPSLPTAAIDHRARRNRRRHETVLAATSVAAVTALVLTGAALAQRNSPPPPAVTPTPTSTPTPTPGPTPDVLTLPTGDPTLPFGECGSMTGSPTALPIDKTLALTTTAATTTLTAGEPLALRTDAEPGTSDTNPAGLMPDRGPSYAVTHDGVVIATGRLYRDSAESLRPYAVWAGDLDAPAQIGFLDLAVCEPADGQPPATPGRALPAGSYELFATLDVTSLGDYGTDVGDNQLRDLSIEDLLALPSARAVTAVSEPLPFSIEGITEVPQERPEPSVVVTELPSKPTAPNCGTPSPTWDADGLFALSHSTTPLTLAVGEPARMDATLTYLGPGRVRGWFSFDLVLWVVRDGVVVGYGPVSESQSDTWAQAEIGSGAGVAAESYGGGYGVALGACGPSTDPFGDTSIEMGDLPAGEYQLLPALNVWLMQVTHTDGTAVTTDSEPFDWGMIIGDPIPLTVK